MIVYALGYDPSAGNAYILTIFPMRCHVLRFLRVPLVSVISKRYGIEALVIVSVPARIPMGDSSFTNSSFFNHRTSTSRGWVRKPIVETHSRESRR